jgi:Family of unknown function (DUF5681)
VSKKSHSRSTPNPGWFPKGRSGNLNGRPRASRASAFKVSAFEVLVKKTLTVAGPSGTREITVEEALQQRTYQDALEGKRMAIREVLKWIKKREDWLAKHAPKASCKPSPHHVSPDPDNADAALMLLGIAAPNPEHANISRARAQLLLEPWAVQAALRRRRGGSRLTDRERNEIRRCTRDPDCLRWPRGTGE